MLVTFIISQNRNIPAIRRSVEMLAMACGDLKRDRQGRSYYAFPAPEAVAALSQEQLKGCKLGYRCKYVSAAAAAVIDGEIDLTALKEADEAATLKALTDIYGVGKKVASCVSLFGLHHVDAFPVDVWVKRILAREYPDGYPYERYSPYNGIYQQYMFYYDLHGPRGSVNGQA
jgi:N-glycosylase/DNA lyase